MYIVKGIQNIVSVLDSFYYFINIDAIILIMSFIVS